MRINRKNIILICCLLISSCCFAQKGKADSLLHAYRNVDADKALKARDTSVAWLLNDLAMQLYLNHPDSAFSVSQMLMDYSQKIQYQEGVATAHGWMGYLLQRKGLIEESLKHQQYNLKLREQMNDQNGAAQALMNIAYILNQQGNSDKALANYLRCAKIFEVENNYDDLASAINNVAMVYDRRKQRDSALIYFNKSLEIARSVNDSQSVAVALHNIGCTYVEMRKYPKGEDLLLRAKEIREIMKDQLGIIGSLISLSDLKYKTNSLSEAESFAKEALRKSGELGYVAEMRDAADVLKDIYLMKKDFGAALEMYELFTTMRDSVNNEVTRKASIRSQLRYEYEKKAAADSVAHARESELKDAALNRQQAELSSRKNEQFVLFGGLALVVFFAWSVGHRFRKTRQQKLLIEEQKNVVEQQKIVIDQKQKEILDSIRYARRIQMAQLPKESVIAKHLARLMR